MSLATVRTRSSLYASSSRLALRQSGHVSTNSNLAGFDRYQAIRSFFTRPLSSTQLTAHTSPAPVSARIGFALKSLSRQQPHSSRFYVTQPRKNNPTRDHDSPSSSSSLPPSHQSSPLHKPPDGPGEPPTETQKPHNYDNYPRFFRRLAMSLPHLSRPTREDFLNAANGFSERMRVRFRWFFIRNFRKFNADDISAFITWFFDEPRVVDFDWNVSSFGLVPLRGHNRH